MFQRPNTSAVADDEQHRRIKEVRSDLWLIERRVEDAHALAFLQPLTINRPLLPMTGASLRPHCLAHVINDILVNRRRRILEFGTGISTLMIGRLIRQNGLDASVLSIDHDEHWVATATRMVEAEGLAEVIQVVCAPLHETELSLDGCRWYDETVLREAAASSRFDMVLVDGPPAWQPGIGRARFPALPFALERLESQASIYLDDANRAGERSVTEAWTHRYSVPFQVTGETLAYAYLGEAFYTEPLTKLRH
jgi:predicted O-methyltransferase YrrM